jgi:hypothetical protein
VVHLYSTISLAARVSNTNTVHQSGQHAVCAIKNISLEYYKEMFCTIIRGAFVFNNQPCSQNVENKYVVYQSGQHAICAIKNICLEYYKEMFHTIIRGAFESTISLAARMLKTNTLYQSGQHAIRVRKRCFAR